MTVGELIEQLELYPRDMRVVSYVPDHVKRWVDHGGPFRVLIYESPILSRDGYYREWNESSDALEIEAIEI